MTYGRLVKQLQFEPVDLDGFATVEELLAVSSTIDCGSETVNSVLLEYGECKAIAMKLREANMVEAAKRWEARCEVLYCKLPKWAQW